MTLASLYPLAAGADPSGPALIGADTTVSWEEAERTTAGLAAALVGAGLRQGDRVAVVRAKGVRSYLAVHGILRAGGVVVPIDPLAPARHVRAVLHDAGVSAVIGDDRTLGAVGSSTLADPCLRLVVGEAPVDVPAATTWDDAVDAGGVELPTPRPDDLAYVIYTSGSTGAPKGIVHTHRSAMAYAQWAADAHLRPGDRVAGISGFHYDMSTLELYACPYAGIPVVVMGEAHLRFPAEFVARSSQERVTVWYAVTSMLRQVVARGAVADHDLSALRTIMFAGEPYPPGGLRELFAAFPDVEIANVYGPAEVNECTYHVLSAPPSGDDDVPLGPPWYDVDCRVVDDDGVDVEPGTLGELWVSAPTVMDGYWGRPELSASKLHPRQGEAPPWYATGDLVVSDCDGVLWFRGRVDNQIKLRGVRVELEGVETVVTDAPGVAQAVVGPDLEGSEASTLVAAVVPEDGGLFDEGAVRRFCTERLPGALVPRRLVIHDRFPLTPSGKIDRSAVRRTMSETTTRAS